MPTASTKGANCGAPTPPVAIGSSSLWSTVVVGSHELIRHASTSDVPDYAIWVNVSANRCRLVSGEITFDALPNMYLIWSLLSYNVCSLLSTSSR